MSAQQEVIYEEQLADDVATILLRRLKNNGQGNDIIKLLHIVFLTTDETASLLGVKPRTIGTWISHGIIPVRYVNKEPRFLLAELLNWTLPENDRHAGCRLSTAASCTLVANRPAATPKGE